MAKLLEKLLSGRLILTVIAGSVFAYASIAKLLDAQAISSIVMMVFVSYFNRHDRQAEGKNGSSSDNK